MRFCATLARDGSMRVRRNPELDNTMRFELEYNTFAALNEKLRVANEVTSELMTEILDLACQRAALLRHSAMGLRFKQLLDACAWTDSAMALIELELPLWHIRRIAYEAGEWHCALSRQCEFPDWLDQAVESRHANLALAILSTFVETRCTLDAAEGPGVSRAGEMICDIPMCCDHFS
jgi:hypothetical protein